MEREEGELTDQDLEDVSDNSSLSTVPFVIPGKSRPLATNRAPFRELSLTSVSDDSAENKAARTRPSYRIVATRNVCRRHCKCRPQHQKYVAAGVPAKRARRLPDRGRRNGRKQYSSVSSGSSPESACYVQDRRVLRQLRDAVRINSSRTLPNCSLRTRLKRMIEPVSQGSKNSVSEDEEVDADDEDDLQALRDQALASKVQKANGAGAQRPNDSITDEDLRNLRLIALKSAMIKKHQERRKRKEEQAGQAATGGGVQKAGAPADREPTLPAPVEPVAEPALVAEPGPPVVVRPADTAPTDAKNIDEDEDILRAMLLTSISRKIANKKQQGPGAALLPPAPTGPGAAPLPPPPPAPTGPGAAPLPPPPPAPPPAKRTAALPAPVNRIVINVNSDSESDAEPGPVAKRPAGPSDLFDKSLALFLKQARAKSDTDHQSDIARHLPRSQQLEYRRLKRKLQQMSSKKADGVVLANKRLQLTGVLCNRNLVRSTNGDGAGLRQIGGRAQVKGRYEELAPLMARVSEARDARDQAQAQVKQLINELRVARSALTSSHQTYSVLMHRLVTAKGTIDKRLAGQEQRNGAPNPVPAALCTSTPNKTTVGPENNCELSRIDEPLVCTAPEGGDAMQVTEIHTVQPMDLVVDEDDEAAEQSTDAGRTRVVDQDTCSTGADRTGLVDQDTCSTGADRTGLVDQDTCSTGADRTGAVDQDTCRTGNTLRYSSPLDHMQPNRETPCAGNPLLVLCPYDLLGECRDPDCWALCVRHRCDTATPRPSKCQKSRCLHVRG